MATARTGGSFGKGFAGGPDFAAAAAAKRRKKKTSITYSGTCHGFWTLCVSFAYIYMGVDT